MNLSLIKARMAFACPSFACACETITQHSEHCVMGVASTAEKNVFTAAKIVRYTQKNIFIELKLLVAFLSDCSCPSQTIYSWKIFKGRLDPETSSKEALVWNGTSLVAVVRWS